MKVVITGSRGWTDKQAIFRRLVELPDSTTVIAGGARGADTIAAEACETYNHLTLQVFPADWEKYGKRAGFIRNAQMLDEQPDLVLAFWDGESKGTLGCMKEAQRRGIPVEVIRERPETGA